MSSESQRINILMVDDNPHNLFALEAVLQAPDRNLVRATSGDEALRYLLDREVAVILLDVYMPGIDGLETAALIRGRERSRDIPIIFLTADSTGSRHLSKGYSLGAVDYILKPIEPNILRSKVAVFVELFKKTEEVKRQAQLLHEKNIELENANLERLSMLVELGQQLAAERNPLRLLEKFCHAARAIVGARRAAVGMLDETGRGLRHFLCCGSDAAAAAIGADIPMIGQDLFATLLKERRPVRLIFDDDAAPPEDLDLLSPGQPVRALLGAPILSATQVYGWLYLADPLNAGEFNEADERLAGTLTAQVAVVYENARLYTEARRRAAELRQEVAERKQAEEERARLLIREQASRAEAEAANRTKDEFLATLSHELRTPLTAILGWSHLLRSGNLPQESADSALRTIERSARAQSQLIDDLLDVSRIITGKLRLDVRPLDLKSVIAAAIDSVRPAAIAKDIELRMELDSAAGMIMGDPDRLQQVVWNLFANAVKFTPGGGSLSVRLGRTNSCVEITVSDTGQGISREFLPHVFDRFRQADGTPTRAYGGLGLGLAVVRHLVELHGGTVHASSEGEGRGATFTVNLPLIPVQPRDEDFATRNETLAAEEPAIRDPRSATLEGARVLVVDDELDTRELVSILLAGCGAEVRASGSTAEAFDVLGSWKPDVLVSDVGMPGEDGYGLIKRIRELDPQRGGLVPAVALTAYASVEDRTCALAAGFQMHMAKPIDPGELVAAIAKLIKRDAE